jgi:hypothetical protein
MPGKFDSSLRASRELSAAAVDCIPTTAPGQAGRALTAGHTRAVHLQVLYAYDA